MTLDVGSTVRIKGTYANPSCTIPVTGTITDILDWGDGQRFVVWFDETAVKAGLENGMMGVPPGGEFSPDRLEAA